MKAQPISVIIPVRGAGTFLSAALHSVAAQSVAVNQCLVVDDGMERSACEIVAAAEKTGLPIQMVEGPRRGPAAARNRGIECATGSLIAFIDDDDLWPADKLARQCQYLSGNADAMAVGGRIHWFHQWDKRHWPVPSSQDQSVIHVNLGAYVFRRELFDQIGHLDESFTYSEDVDLILRTTDSGVGFAILDDVMLLYRRHLDSMTAQNSDREKVDFRRALFASLKRRKGTQSRKLEEYLVSDRTDA